MRSGVTFHITLPTTDVNANKSHYRRTNEISYNDDTYRQSYQKANITSHLSPVLLL